MLNDKSYITVFLIITTLTILLLAGLIITLIYMYQKKQLLYHQGLEALKLNHENNLLETRLEIQEHTFQHISREIHDNINLSLTLAKLHLNTISLKDLNKTVSQVNLCVELLSDSIINLSNISKSLNSDIITSQGLLKALENEIQRIEIPDLLTINLTVVGDPVYLETQKELLIFRIIQEAFNNIIKHSRADHVELNLDYDTEHLKLSIKDNGKGFSSALEDSFAESGKAGLKNMATRTNMIGGMMHIESKINYGTTLFFTIPLN